MIPFDSCSGQQKKADFTPCSNTMAYMTGSGPVYTDHLLWSAQKDNCLSHGHKARIYVTPTQWQSSIVRACVWSEPVRALVHVAMTTQRQINKRHNFTNRLDTNRFETPVTKTVHIHHSYKRSKGYGKCDTVSYYRQPFFLSKNLEHGCYETGYPICLVKRVNW